MASPPSGQWRVLTEAFLLRFFENESMSSASDLREGFFWVIAALATPGIFLPLYMYFRWAEVAAVKGLSVMHVTVLLDKTIYLDLSFVGIGILTAVIWQALLFDRRDGLILGALPVHTRTAIVAKLSSLGLYAALISAGMHGAATLLYGLGFSSIERWTMLLRFMGGQFLAAAAANLFVFALVIGAQSAAIAIWGPRRFTRISSLLQLLVVGSSTGLLLLLPFLAGGATSLARWPAERSGVLLWMPPIWFLGLNEVISGTTFPIMPVLATRALIALAAALLLVLIAYPVGAARTLSSAVVGTGSLRPTWTRSIAAWLARHLGRNPHERAATQFVLSAISRSHQQRLILAVAGGAALTMAAPAVLGYMAGTNIDVWSHYWDPHGPAPAVPIPTVLSHYSNFHRVPPSMTLVAAPLLVNFVLTLGLRLALSIPSELPAAWVFAAAPAPMFAGRNAAHRLLVLLAVVLPLAVITPVWWWSWGWRLTLPIVAACALGMLTVVHASLWGFVGIPCAKPLAPGRSELSSRWPFLLLFLYFFADVFPSYQVGLILRPGPQYMLILPLVIYLAVRYNSQSAAYANAMSGDPHGYISLDLSTTAALKSGVRTEHAG